MKDWLMKLSIVAGVLGAVLAMIAANVPVRDNIDLFMADLHRQGWWASWAAFAAAIGVLLQAWHYFMSR